MSRPPSVLVTRDTPDHRELVKMFKKEKDGAMVRRLNAIILMLEFQDAEQVAPTCRVDADTVRRWVKEFNEGGVEALREKKKLWAKIYPNPRRIPRGQKGNPHAASPAGV